MLIRPWREGGEGAVYYILIKGGVLISIYAFVSTWCVV